MKGHILNRYPKSYPFITEGYVMDTDDPDQMGRLKIWCPAIDGESFRISSLPWAEYASPFAGVAVDMPAGRDGVISHGPQAYGFWAIPKMNAQVLVFLLNGNAARRFYFASYNDLHRNRSLPGGRNFTPDPPDKRKVGPWTDSYDPLQPAYNNLREQFGPDLGNPVAQTRGVNERQAAQDKDAKDGTEGYAPAQPDPNGYKDPQSYCMVTPGHHYITMNDNPDNCRVRVKTAEGHQVIMDDTNERIYISTAKGNTWIEMDEDGHIHIYGGKSISIRAEEDLNLVAGRNVNIQGQSGVNIKSFADTRVEGGNVHIKAAEILAASGCTVDLNGSKTRVTGESVDIKSSGLFAMEGSKVTVQTGTTPHDADKDQLILPGGPASEASCAVAAMSPSIIPTHEPFVRPKNSNRNKRYKG